MKNYDEKDTKVYTYREIAEADIEELIDNAILYEGCEDGVLIDIALSNHNPNDKEDKASYKLRIIGHFDNEDLIEYAKENYGIDLDLETLGPWYQMNDLEVDAHFLDQDRKSYIYFNLVCYTDNSNFVKFNNKEYALLENAYIIENVQDSHDYEAMAMGQDENYYMVKWDMLPGMENESDGGKVCDWKHPASVERVDL